MPSINYSTPPKSPPSNDIFKDDKKAKEFKKDLIFYDKSEHKNKRRHRDLLPSQQS
ncbi:MAG: hypothetical protein HRT47_10540 [Candidatus Caenarcaniphilales bacterium]|nr:hypothetical protein [Candidatus Caenarcaniphilales bacterium]